jgi:hypothetical protein
MIAKLPQECLDQVAQAAAALHPADRDGFVHAAIARLRFEPAIGPRITNRVIRELLATAAYRRAGNLAPIAGRAAVSTAAVSLAMRRDGGQLPSKACSAAASSAPSSVRGNRCP